MEHKKHLTCSGQGIQQYLSSAIKMTKSQFRSCKKVFNTFKSFWHTQQPKEHLLLKVNEFKNQKFFHINAFQVYSSLGQLCTEAPLTSCFDFKIALIRINFQYLICFYYFFLFYTWVKIFSFRNYIVIKIISICPLNLGWKCLHTV